MVKIVDLPLMLRGLEPLLRRKGRERGVEGVFRFVMEDSRQEGILDLGKGRRYSVRLGDRDMVSLFFGILPVGEMFAQTPALSRLGQVLPLPLFVPPLNHV